MAQNMSGSPHRTRRKDNMAQQGLRDGGGYSRGNVGGKSSNPSKSSSLASKSDKAHKREHFTNGGSSGSSGSHEIKVSRNPQAYSSAVSRFADSDREDRDGPSDRTHYIAMNLIGQQVRAILKDGTVYEGIFHNPIFDRGFGVVLHMARKKESSDSGVVQTPPIDQVTVQPQDLVMLDAPEVAFVEDSAEFKKQMMREGGFRTDTEISGRDFSERELVPWSAPDEEGGLGGLEEDQGARNRWDQFEANERLFGVRTTYDERVYTTEIDRQRVTREVVEKAIRIEREIKLQTTSNIHLAEERGIVAPKDDTEDEEDKYSSVLREQKGPGPKFGAQSQKGGGAYVVPAKRKGEAEAAAAPVAEPRDGGNNKAREHEFRKLRQREQEIEREREREREKEKEREKARQRERERIDRERAAKGLAPSSPSTSAAARASSSSSSTSSASAAALSSGLSRSTTSIANLADETHRAPPSPSVPSKLTNSPFRQRSFSMSNISAAVDESGAANPDPEDPQYLEKLRVQKLLTEMRAQGIDPRAAAERLKEPFHSPIVGRPEQLKSLDLSPAVPRVPESVLQEFQQYKEQRKRSLSTTSPAVPTKQDMVNFSKEIEKKTSTPNSPALRARRGDHNHNPIAPSPLSPRHVLDATAAKLEKEGSTTTTTTTTTKPSGPSTSSSTSSSAAPTPAATETPATTPATLATPVAESPASASAATSPRKDSTPAATAATPATAASTSSEAPAAGAEAATADGQPPLSKIQLPSLKSKLNPFAKAFTPKRPAAATAAPPATAPNASSMAATLLSAAAAAGAADKSTKPTVDINIPVSSFFAQGMRRLQDNPEDPEQVAPVWPYGRVPYRQEESGIPMEGYYAPVPNMSPLPPQGRHMGYPPVPYVTSPPPQMGSAQPVMMFPPGQPVPRGFVPQGSIPGPAYYPGGPAGAGPYPPHLYSAPPATPAGGPMGHKGRMGPPYPGAPPHGHGVVPPPHSPHAPPHSPQGTPPRGGQAATAPAGYPPNSPTAFGVVPPPDHGVVPPPHSPHAPTAAPHSPHAPRAGAGPHMVPGPGQGQPPLYTFPPPGAPHLLGDPAALAGVPPSMVVPGPGMAPPPRGAGGYRGYGQQPPQMAQQQPQQGQQQQQQQQQQQRPDGKSSTAAAVQAQPFHPRGGQGSAININAGAFYPGQQRGGGQPAARGGPQQQQQQDKEQRFKVPNTDVLPHQ